MSSNLLSHECRTSFLKAKQILINKVKNRGDLDYALVEKQLNLIEELSQFELGKFLIEHGGFNGYYIHYVNMHPLRNCNNNLDKEGNPFVFLENFILNFSPTSLATQERFTISKKLLQKYLYNGCVFASIPCGLMGEFLELDVSSYSRFSFHGIDLDLETLIQAKEYSKRKNMYNNCEFHKKDAWHLNFKEKFDLITTDGLTIYESSDSRVVDLYQEFYKALKSNGVLLTSFLTPPPTYSDTTEWKLDEINQENALLEKIIIVDILNSKWMKFRTKNLVIAQLQKAGFSILEVFSDRANISPIIVAKK